MLRLREVIAKEFPDYDYGIPEPESININKLGDGGVLTTDTCNSAQKTRRLLVEIIGGLVHEIDCFHHLRNVWFKGVEKALTTYLNHYLKDSLENIDPILRVSCSMSALIRAFDKEFSLCCNYPKGHGEVFCEWIKKKHSGEMLLHVERAGGSRQDLFLEGAPAIYWNRQYCIEFLDEQLRMSCGGNILQENLFIVQSSLEMVALSRLCSIFFLCICAPVRWIAGNTHTLQEYNWGARSMGRIVDILEMKLVEINQTVDLVLDQNYMMGLFDDIVEELPPFKEYLKYMYEKKTMFTIGKSKSKEVPLALLRNEIFHPQIEDNVSSTELVKKLALIATEAFLVELRDTRKATYKYLSSSGSKFSYEHCPEETKKDMLGKMATNDLAESSFGGVTNQLQKYSRVNITSAAAVSDMQKNNYLTRDKKKGLFHEFPDEIQIALVLVAMEDAPRTRTENMESLDAQRKAKRAKAEILKQAGMEKATEEYIDAIYYFKMYHSMACWKSVLDVNDGLKKLQTKKDKYESIKENIRIRVKGFGWEQFNQAWSKNGKPYSVEFLADKLKSIIKKEKKLTIPNEPPIKTPMRKKLPILGSQIMMVKNLDENYIREKKKFKGKANNIRKEREKQGIGSIYSELQPKVRPEIDQDLIGRRIDVLFKFDILDRKEPEQALRWCQGEVTRIFKEKKKPTVEVLWDEVNESIEKESRVRVKSSVELYTRKWNKDCEGAWRMDISMENLSGSDNDNEDN